MQLESKGENILNSISMIINTQSPKKTSLCIFFSHKSLLNALKNNLYLEVHFQAVALFVRTGVVCLFHSAPENVRTLKFEIIF